MDESSFAVNTLEALALALMLSAQLTDELRAALVLESAAEVESWFTRLDCLVVGPGLGRDPLMLDVARAIIVRARQAALPMVLDGDALLLVAREPELVQGNAGVHSLPF